MIASRPLRALLGAAFCCVPLLGALAASPPDTASPAGGAPAGGTSANSAVSVHASAEYSAGQASAPLGQCFSLAGEPLLAAAGALPAPGTTRPAPPPNPLQRLRRNGALQPNQPVNWSADQATATQGGHVTLSGHAELSMGDREFQADRMTYDSNTNDVNVSGHVRFSDPTLHVQGGTGHYGDAGGQFSSAQFQFLTHAGHGTAQIITTTPDNRVVTLRMLYYTSCPIGHRADWDIRARSARMDNVANRGVARDTLVDFEGVPIIYLPYLSFPLSSARQSGVLFPNIGTNSRDGAIIGVPWYWNIAPNQDATFTPTEYTSRGLDLGTEYRYLGSDDSGIFDGDFLPHDSSYGSERSYGRLLDRLDLPDNTRVQADLESVSDTEYFEDFTQGTQATSTAFLPRDIQVLHRDDIWDVDLESVDFQSLDATLPVYERPYVQTPRMDADAHWSPAAWPWLTTGFSGEAVNFSRDACTLAVCNELGNDAMDFPDGVGVNGWRLDAEPHLGLDFTQPGYFLRPDVSWDVTQYELRGAVPAWGPLLNGLAPSPDDAARSGYAPLRALPIVTVDSGLTFDRLSSDDSRTVTLEPRVMYVYIPYRDQDGLPLFDTSEPDPNLIELFQPNRYVGLDRVGDANQFTVGLTTQMFSTATGARFLSASIGQSIYLTPPRVALPGQTLDPHTSDLIGEVNVAAYHNWNVQLDLASNAEVSRIEQAETLVQYRAGAQQVVNVGYQYRQGQFQQVDVSTAWPIVNHWDLYARAVYSLLDHASIEDFAGFQYRGSCWGVRALWQRFVSTRTGERSTGFSLQLELLGLSNVGSEVDTFLRQQIRGYSTPAAGRLPATSTPVPTPAAY
jgi:LPS-assembly protein